jgi:SAM-dependent methyltransferase
MISHSETRRPGGLDPLTAALARGAQWGLDRTLSVGYGIVYDYIFERFRPYQVLRGEILRFVEAGVPPSVPRHDVRVLDIGCGPGNSTLMLGEAGYTVLGIDPYGVLIDLAREKRRAKRLPNVAFRHADLVRDGGSWRATYDQVVNVHSLYAHPEPLRLLEQAWHVLKPGGHGVFVNFTRRVPLVATFADVQRREGLASALRCLQWVLPNALFELTRRRIGPHYWPEQEFAVRLEGVGFTVLEMKRTFLDGVSLLAWVRKDLGEKGR